MISFKFFVCFLFRVSVALPCSLFFFVSSFFFCLIKPNHIVDWLYSRTGWNVMIEIARERKEKEFVKCQVEFRLDGTTSTTTIGPRKSPQKMCFLMWRSWLNLIESKLIDWLLNFTKNVLLEAWIPEFLFCNLELVKVSTGRHLLS